MLTYTTRGSGLTYMHTSI